MKKLISFCVCFSMISSISAYPASAENHNIEVIPLHEIENNAVTAFEMSNDKLLEQTASARDGEYVIPICDGWKFGDGNGAKDKSFNDSAWENVTLPHTWNAADAADGNNSYSRTSKWYRKKLNWQESFENKLVYIEFTGANTKTDLYVNGERVLINKAENRYTHRGGYTAFRYNISDYLTKGENIIAVNVDNKRDEDIAPISGDFNMYGGIYRPVYLVVVDKVHIDLENNGSSGIFLTTPGSRSKTAPASLGELNIRTDIINDCAVEKTVTVTAKVLGDNAPEPISETVSIAPGGKYTFNKNTRVNSPHLWKGVSYEENADNSDVGYRYTVEITVTENGSVIDRASDKVGFRYFWIDKDEGFYLNGEKHPLRGVCRHQFRQDKGSALTAADHDEDMALIKEMGANTIRLSHYPQADYFYDLCDENGIVVWSEIPLVNQLGTAWNFPKYTKEQLVEMIRQQYNRPSICFWGLQNEVGNGPSSNNNIKMKQLIYELDALAKQEDTTGRYTTQAVNQNYSMNQNNENGYGDFSNNNGWKSDLIGWNIYPGWYGNFQGSFSDVMSEKRSKDSRPMCVSEYGWGSNVNQHEAYPQLNKGGLTPYGWWHPEEYQNIMHEQAIDYINNNDYLWGTYLWAMFDFPVDSRNEGSQPGLNDKGLVTGDRKIKKDSFYLYKANYNKKDKFTYITSRRWVSRDNSNTYIKVYSNCGEVELFKNGESLGKMTPKGNGVFEMGNVELGVGKNTIKAVGASSGAKYEDEVVWDRALSSKAEVTSDSLIVDEETKQILLTDNITLSDLKAIVKGVNNASYSVYENGVEITDANAAIRPNMIILVTAEDGATTSEYRLVSANICVGKKVAASSAENGNFESHAVDGDNGTRWTAVNNSYPQSITVDLEDEYFAGKLQLEWYSASDRYYSYDVETSVDGVVYEKLIDRRDNTSIGLTEDSLGMTSVRYLRINVYGCSNSAGYASLYEIRLNGWNITSDIYTIDHYNKVIIAPALGDGAGLTPDKFLDNLNITGNCTYDIKVGTGYVNDGDTLVVTTQEGTEHIYTISLPQTAGQRTTNAALGKKVYFSTQEKRGTDGKDTHAYSAFDGDLNTRWASETHGGTSASYPEWIGVDLGAEYTLSDIELYLETKGERTYTYEVYTSLDVEPVSGINAIPSGYEKIVDMSSNTTGGGHYSHKLDGVKGRYVIVKILSCDKWSNSTKYVAPSVYEIIVNGRTETLVVDDTRIVTNVARSGNELSYTVDVFGDTAKAKIIVALYGEDGSMVDVKMDCPEGRFEFPEGAKGCISFMLWDMNNISPLIKAHKEEV